MLDESAVYAVDVTELKTERWVRLPYPSEATGMSFDEAAQKIGGDESVEYTSRPQ
jgi:hypothetical protein